MIRQFPGTGRSVRDAGQHSAASGRGSLLPAPRRLPVGTLISGLSMIAMGRVWGLASRAILRTIVSGTDGNMLTGPKT